MTGTLDAWSGYLALRGAHERAAALTRENRQLTLERQALLQEKAGQLHDGPGQLVVAEAAVA